LFSSERRYPASSGLGLKFLKIILFYRSFLASTFLPLGFQNYFKPFWFNQINSINSLINFINFKFFQIFQFSKFYFFTHAPAFPAPTIIVLRTMHAMLRGWDLPIQANISVSFNTKLIPFNLVIAAVPEPYSTYIYTTCASSSRPASAPALPVAVRPPPLSDRPITAASSRKSKISFLLG
jgi:hypothetical protein